jgi:hypothetical protein
MNFTSDFDLMFLSKMYITKIVNLFNQIKDSGKATPTWLGIFLYGQMLIMPQYYDLPEMWVDVWCSPPGIEDT